jgi:hypothetical protein
MDDSEQLVPRISVVAVDCADPRKVGAFWQQLLGGTLSEDDEGVVELRGGPIGLDFVHVPEPKRAKNRLHLDLAVPYAVRAQAIDRALALGATRADDLYDSGHWQVLRDPEANEFCLVWGGQL